MQLIIKDFTAASSVSMPSHAWCQRRPCIAPASPSVAVEPDRPPASSCRRRRSALQCNTSASRHRGVASLHHLGRSASASLCRRQAARRCSVGRPPLQHAASPRRPWCLNVIPSVSAVALSPRLLAWMPLHTWSHRLPCSWCSTVFFPSTSPKRSMLAQIVLTTHATKWTHSRRDDFTGVQNEETKQRRFWCYTATPGFLLLLFLNIRRATTL